MALMMFPGRLNLTRWLVLRAGEHGDRVNLECQRAGRQIEAQRCP